MSNDILRGRQTVAVLTNKSGGQVVEGDVVVLDSTTSASFTTTTSEKQSTLMVGVALETIGNDAQGRVCLFGYVAKINLTSSASISQYLATSTTAKQAVPSSSQEAGDFGQALGTGASPAALIWGTPLAGVGGGGGNAWNIHSNTISEGTTVTVEEGHTAVLGGPMIVEGELIVDGGVVIL